MEREKKWVGGLRDKRLLEFVRGRVSFRATNGNLERFLNLAKSRGVSLFRITRIEEGLSGQTLCKCYRKAASAARACGVRLRIEERWGLPFFLHRHRKRLGIPAGVCLFLTFLLLSQNFLWEISFSPDSGKEEQEKILNLLNGYGVSEGAYLPDLNFRKVQHDILQETETLSWIALNRKGVRLEVKATPREKPEDFASELPCDVVAERAGQILHVEALSGETVVRSKQIVREGDLLISGILDYPLEGKGLYTHADGKVFAQTVRKKELSFSLTQKEKKYSGKEKVRKTVSVLGIRLPLYIAFDLPQKYDVETEEKRLVLNQKKMPFALEEQNYRFYEEVDRTYTEEEGKTFLKQEFEEYEKTELADAEILKVEEGFRLEDGKLVGMRRYTCNENIARKVKIPQVNTSERPQN